MPISYPLLLLCPSVSSLSLSLSLSISTLYCSLKLPLQKPAAHELDIGTGASAPDLFSPQTTTGLIVLFQLPFLLSFYILYSNRVISIYILIVFIPGCSLHIPGVPAALACSGFVAGPTSPALRLPLFLPSPSLPLFSFHPPSLLLHYFRNLLSG